MKTRIVLALALVASSGEAQTPRQASLPAFRSEAELARFLETLPGARRAPPPQGVPAAPSVSCGGASPTVVVPRAGGAQGPAVVRGRIADGAGAPLPGSTVRIEALNLGTVTDPGGEFRLEIPADRLAEPRTMFLAVSRIGFQSKTLTLKLQRGDSARVQIPLCAAALNLEALVVTAAGAANESVTNVQHEGVDEGGIVKVHGDHLVMLRRGRLFTVAIGNGRLAPVSAVDAFGPGIDPEDGWYDELLVSGDQVVVLGYSYGASATEVGIFRIDRAGRLSHRATYHLRSNDYYSSRNYASRLVGSKLVMYTPLQLRGDLAASLPALRRWRPGAEEEEFRPIVSATRIFRPGRAMSASDSRVLHTVMTCDLARREMRCEGTAVLGLWGSDFYVSPGSVYVWVSRWANAAGGAPSTVYRIPLSGGAPTALGVAGSPVDQFSFLESADGHLNVLVRGAAHGNRMWSAERSGGGVALLRVPLSRFAGGAGAAPASSYRDLPAPHAARGSFHNRFVGRHLLYGDGNGWNRPGGGGSALYAVPWAGGRVSRVPLPHPIDRIEAMGSDAVVVGADTSDLHFTGIALRGRPRTAQRYVSRGASQGELRSHGFFYRADDESAGVLGLPIRGPGRPGYEHLFEESASILFLRNENARFRELGELAARAEGSVDDGCVASCVDWYGNARPLFLRGRVFALLGYEIVEGTLDGGRLRELRRVSYAPGGTAVTAR